MAKMGRYCKAYPAEALRKFSGWTEKVPPLHIKVEPKEGEGEPGQTQEQTGPLELDYYYVQEDYTVTAGVFLNEDVAFANVNDEWKEFCIKELNFELPDYEPVNAGENAATVLQAK